MRLNETRRAVHFPAFSAARDRRMRVARNLFGGIFLRFSLKSIAAAVPNRAKVRSELKGKLSPGTEVNIL